MVTRKDEKVRIHPASVNAKCVCALLVLWAGLRCAGRGCRICRGSCPRAHAHWMARAARCRLEVAAPEPGEPDFAALLFYDEITRGDAFLCEWLAATCVCCRESGAWEDPYQLAANGPPPN